MTFKGYDDWTEALDYATARLRNPEKDDVELIELWPELVDAFLIVEMRRPEWAQA